MHLKQLQTDIDAWITTVGVKYFSPLTNMAVLTEEVGEVARLMSRMYGDQSFREALTPEEQQEKLRDEMADVLWVLCCLANQTGVDLEKAMEKNFLKKNNRDKDRHQDNKKLNN